jgi:hypothetical protein
MTNKVLAETVIRVLSDPAITRVNFQLYGRFVTGNRYLSMMSLYSMGFIDCVVGVPPNPDLPPGTARECLYVPEHHRMHFQNEQYGSTSHIEKSNIAHEATHALFDSFYGATGGTHILAIEDEATAWLAQAVYFHRAGLLGGPFIDGSALAEALKLVYKLADGSGAFGSDGRICTVSPADAMPLRQAAAADHKLVGGRATIESVYNGF